MDYRLQKGMTLIEALFVIGILIVLSAITLTALTRTSADQSLEGATRATVAIIQDARARTLASRDDTTYGVHFESDRVVLFSGDTYSAGAPDNSVKQLSARVSITDISLGGGSDVVFSRLSGKPSASGTLTLTAQSEEAPTRTVVIDESGLAYEQ